MHFFGQNDPFHFGSMAMSIWTLFEMCTLDVSFTFQKHLYLYISFNLILNITIELGKGIIY